MGLRVGNRLGQSSKRLWMTLGRTEGLSKVSGPWILETGPVTFSDDGLETRRGGRRQIILDVGLRSY